MDPQTRNKFRSVDIQLFIVPNKTHAARKQYKKSRW